MSVVMCGSHALVVVGGFKWPRLCRHSWLLSPRAASHSSGLKWPTWHLYQAPGWVPAPLGQDASSGGGAPANRCCSPLTFLSVGRAEKTRNKESFCAAASVDAFCVEWKHSWPSRTLMVCWVEPCSSGSVDKLVLFFGVFFVVGLVSKWTWHY